MTYLQYVTRETGWVQHVEQEQITLPEHPQFLVETMLLNPYFFVYCFVDHCRSLCTSASIAVGLTK
jgi:hypothetical protein